MGARIARERARAGTGGGCGGVCSYGGALAASGMAMHAKDQSELIASGSWRARDHAARAGQSAASDDEDARLWQLVDHWQSVFEAARVEVDENGISIQSATQTVKNPACGVMADATKELRALFQVLGVGPLNRARLGASPSDGASDGDEFADMPALPERGKRVPAKA